MKVFKLEKVKLPKVVAAVLDQEKERAVDDAHYMVLCLNHKEVLSYAQKNLLNLAAALEFGYVVDEEHEKRAQVFHRFNREVDQFRKGDVVITHKEQFARVYEGTDKQGNVAILLGNEDEDFMPVTETAAKLTPMFFIEQRLDKEGVL